MKKTVFAEKPESLSGNVTRMPVRRKKPGRRFALLAVLALAAAAVALNWDKLSPPAVVETFQSFFGEFGESRFPVQYAQGTFRAAAPIGSDLGVVTDSGFLVYTSTGRQIAARGHGLSNPRIVSSGGRAVLYDAGGKQLRSETRFAEPFSATLDFPITTAAVSRTGVVAAATSSENYLRKMEVWGASGKKIFNWDRSAGRILTLALSPDGSRCVAGVVLSRGGDIETDLYFYDLSRKDPSAVVRYPGTLLFAVDYRSSTRVLAVGDRQAVSLDANGGKVGAYAYGERTLKCYSASSASTVLALSRYGVGQDSTLVCLTASAGVQATADVSRDIRLVAANGRVAALSPGSLLLFGPSLAKGGSEALAGDISQILVSSDHVYAFTHTAAYQYKAG